VIALLLYLPKYVWGRLVLKKYKRSFLYRLGIKKLPNLTLKAPLLWIHAVSLGEAKVALAFAKAAKEYAPGCSIVVSSTTETGFDEVTKTIPCIDGQFFLPMDFPWLIRPLMKKLNPSLLVFSEGDLWLNLLESAHAIGAKTLVINGKISRKSLQRHLRFKGYTQQMFSCLDHLCVQNDLYKQRFSQLGVTESKISITGNMKLDIPRNSLTEAELKRYRQTLAISPEETIITIGSTHPKEEQMLLQALLPLLSNPSCKMILAPRHPERFNKVEELLQTFCKYGSWSQRHLLQGSEQIILIDTLGELRHCYQIAHVAIVGGSFVDIGGHNLLEPSEYGVASLFGPYIHKQKEFAQMAVEEGIGFQVDIHHLYPKIKEILYNPDLQKIIAQRALTFLSSSRGASLKSWSQAKQLLALQEKNL